MNILLTGPAGSGKTTQARILSQELHLKLIKTGELLREAANSDSSNAILLQKYINEGELIPDDLVAKIVKDEIKKNTGHKGFIFDGYPRRLSQLKAFDPKLDKIIYIEISDKEVLKRLLKRGRDDDKEEIIKERIKVYHKETQPLLKIFEDQNKLIQINGKGTEEEIKERIKQQLITHHLLKQ